MTEVLQSPSSSSSPSISTPTHNHALFQPYGGDEVGARMREEEEVREKRDNERRDQLSVLALLVALFRKSFWVTCKTGTDGFSTGGGGGMEIGWPTDVQHVNHVTFDRFDGFLGLPVEFEPEVPRRAPSASATVFGVSTESMQLSYDHRGNSIPTILLLMQRHLYSRHGLQAEGIFRITAGNSQEEFVRDQLNRGVVPEGTDVHCLAGLIKAWFRELPSGLLDSLSPEQVMQFQSEDDCDALIRLLPPTEAALLDWAINLMADVVQQELFNKMNSHNIAMVFAPNMTQMADPLTALMYAVQVIKFLKTLIEKTLREREESVIEPASIPHMESPGDNGNQSSSTMYHDSRAESTEETVHDFVAEDPGSDTDWETSQVENVSDEDYHSYSSCSEESEESVACGTPRGHGVVVQKRAGESTRKQAGVSGKSKPTSEAAADSGMKKKMMDIKGKESSNLSRINSMTEWFEGWR
ncbi:rho GTPase-activating protein 5-like [Salvia splendens]|uniref:rho GTPase-activating protein 5-like n=1 Tax=Salvia splendens TaxID=180675 RepID=UPI001C271D28|nr:rho GTPase-activating protein 5-like [Salvia splendens]